MLCYYNLEKMVEFKLTINVILLFVYCVNSSAVNEKSIDIKVSNIPKFSGGAINIPVAVVFEDRNRKDKSVNLNLSGTTKSNDTEKQNDTESSTLMSISENKTETIVSFTPKKVEPVVKKPQTELVDMKEAMKPNIDITSTEKLAVTTNTKSILNKEKELQIPVAVVYDEPKDVASGAKFNRRRQSKRIEKTNKNQLNAQSGKVVNNQTNNENNTSRNFRRKIQVPIVQSENYVFSHSGDFHYSYESGDGTKASERGRLKSIDDNTGEAVVGSFSYIGKDGNDYSLTYTADENGYRPVGAHLPTPPPIPPAIARALKYLATKTTPEPVTEPSK